MATARHNGGERREGLDIGTLAVAALAAVVAAVVTSKLWPGGTMLSTAMTPVIVALVKEWLRKPAERVSAVTAKAPEVAARVVAPARETVPRRGPVPAPTVPTREGEQAMVPPAGSPAAGTPPEEMFVERAPADAPSGYRLYRRRGPHWRLAVVTGLVAFAVAVLAITVPELVLGGAVSGKGDTTVFGGGSARSDQSRDQEEKRSEDKRSGERSTTSEPDPQQAAPKSSSQSRQGSTGSSSSKQAPSSSSSPNQDSQGTSSAPSAPSGAQGAPGAPGSGASSKSP